LDRLPVRRQLPWPVLKIFMPLLQGIFLRIVPGGF
jgi:hypothetical protein